MKLMKQESLELVHFIKLARRGRYAGASGGEQRAYRIAAVLVEDCAGLDGMAVAGIAWFARLASASSSMAEKQISGEPGQAEEVAENA